MIQSLESRMFLSVTADTLSTDINKLLADAKAITSAEIVRLNTFGTALKTITKDIKPLDNKTNTKINNRLLQQLRQNAKLYNTELTGDVNKVNSSISHITATAGTHGKALIKSPTSASLHAKVAKDIAYIQGTLTARINALLPELVAANIDGFQGYFTSIPIENPSLNDICTAIVNDTTAKTAVVTDATNQLQADANVFAGDLGGIAG